MAQFLRPSVSDGHRSHSRSRRSREPTPEPKTRRRNEDESRDPRTGYHHHYPFEDRSRRSTTPQPRSRHARTASWPPSPSVEDETASLAKEVNSPRPTKLDTSDVRSRGSLEQQPIILEVNEQSSAKTTAGRDLGRKNSRGSLREPGSLRRPAAASRQNSKETRPGLSALDPDSGVPPELSSRPPSTYSFTPRTRNGSHTSLTDSDYSSASEARAARDADKRKPTQGLRDNVMSDALRGQGKSRESNANHRRVPSGPFPDVGRSQDDAARVLAGRASNRYSYTRSDLESKDQRTPKDLPTKLTEAKTSTLHAARRNSDSETTLPRSHPDGQLRAAAVVGAAGGAAAYTKNGRLSTSRPSSPIPSPPRSPRPSRPHYKDDPPRQGGRRSGPSSREGSRASSPTRFEHPRRTSTFPAIPDDRTQRTSRLVSSESTPESDPHRTPNKRQPHPGAALPYPVDDMNLMPSVDDHRYRPRPLDSSSSASIPAHRDAPTTQPLKRNSLNNDPILTRPRPSSRHTVNTGDLPVLSTGSSLQSPGSATLTESPVATRGFEAMTPKPPPPCPRSKSSRDYNDWYTLDKLPSFDMCPFCYEASFAMSPFRRSLKRAAPMDVKRKCDFASPWVRLAWLMTQQQQRHDIDLVYAMARIGADEECPNDGKDTRTWYTILDKYGDKVEDFNVCSTDVRRVEALMPSMAGIFTRNHGGAAKRRRCDFRIESKRFSEYLDTLMAVEGAAQAKRRPPDLQRFADFVCQKAQLRECSRDDLVMDMAWHFPPQLPDLTVCEECYVDVIWPAIAEGSSVASRFSKTPHLLDGDRRRGAGPSGISCQLYSMRMRRIFKKAVQTGDFEYLARRAQERKDKEMELHMESDRVKRLQRDVEKMGMKPGRETAGLRMQQQQVLEQWRMFE